MSSHADEEKKILKNTLDENRVLILRIGMDDIKRKNILGHYGSTTNVNHYTNMELLKEIFGLNNTMPLSDNSKSYADENNKDTHAYNEKESNGLERFRNNELEKRIREWWIIYVPETNCWACLFGISGGGGNKTGTIEICMIHDDYVSQNAFRKLVFAVIKHRLTNELRCSSNIKISQNIKPDDVRYSLENYNKLSISSNSIRSLIDSSSSSSSSDMPSMFINHPIISRSSKLEREIIGGGISSGHMKRVFPKFRIKMDIFYTNMLASKLVESNPRLHIFPSYDFSTTSKVYNLTDSETTSLKNVVFKANMNMDYVPIGTCLNFIVFTDYLNDENEKCANQAGSFFIQIYDILNELQTSPTGKYRKEFLLKITAADGFVKGKMRITVNSMKDISFSPNVSFLKSVPSSSSSSSHIGGSAINNIQSAIISDGIQKKEQDAHVMAYIEQNADVFKNKRPSYQAIKNIHTYLYKDHISGRYVPSSAFDFPISRLSSEAFMLNILDIVLNRYNQTREWFVDSSNTTSMQEISRVVTEMSTVYVNWCKYIADIVYTSRRGNYVTDTNIDLAKKQVKYIESFDWVPVRDLRPGKNDVIRHDPTDSSDCEDFAKQILEFFHQLNVGIWKTPEIKKAQHNCSLFINFSTLGGVGGPKLDGHFERLKNMNAHEWVIRIPKYLFWKWLKAGSPNDAIHAIVSETEKQLGRGLKVLVAEGTGLLYPDENSDPAGSFRTSLEKKYPGIMPKLRKRYTFKRNEENSFYKTATTLFTGDFITAQKPYPEFSFWKCKKDSGPPLTYGVNFLDIASHSENICIVAHPPMMKPVRQAIKDLMNNFYHAPPFKAPTTSQKKIFENSEFIRMLEPYIKRSEITEYSYSSKQKYINDPNATTGFIKFHNATKEVAMNLIQMLKKENLKVIIKTELVTAYGLGGYFIIIIK